TWSPSATSTLTISASVSPSPRSGSLNSLAGGTLEGQRLANGFQHALGVGDPAALAGEARVDDVWRGDAARRCLELEEGRLDDPTHDLGADAAGPLRLVGPDGAARLPDRGRDRLGVHGRDRDQVDDLDLGPVLRLHPLGRVQALVEHRPVPDQREVAALAGDPGLPDGPGLLGVGHLLADRVVQRLRLEEDDGI